MDNKECLYKERIKKGNLWAFYYDTVLVIIYIFNLVEKCISLYHEIKRGRLRVKRNFPPHDFLLSSWLQSLGFVMSTQWSKICRFATLRSSTKNRNSGLWDFATSSFSCAPMLCLSQSQGDRIGIEPKHISSRVTQQTRAEAKLEPRSFASAADSIFSVRLSAYRWDSFYPLA